MDKLLEILWLVRLKRHKALLNLYEYKAQQMEKELLKCKTRYEDIIIPDRKIEEIRSKFGDLSQKGLQMLLDYLNWDKYLIVQWVMKTMNTVNAIETIAYLDWALSRIEWLIVTIGKHIKQENKSEVTE